MRRPTLKERVPEHLHPFIADQDPALYTAIDHASWRYIMKVSQAFFAEHAHQKYLDGLRETGISTDRIPMISEMDACLAEFGWRAVAVVGFIPPAVFMEFLSLGVLPIACDMRSLEHLGYTPAPDIVHEAAGHAPIIADPEYADYLLQYGEVSRRVIYSSQDMDVYEAIRNLSDVKENPASTADEIGAAQERLDRTVAAVGYVSEAAQLARMNWWTIEYGLVGPLDRPKIYGAGLLSSVAESYHCFAPDVRKIPFSIDCIEMSYDITRPQPQLFVTPDFQTLKKGLEEFADRLAFRKGGLDGLRKAIRAATTTTVELDSGVQISGTLKDVLLDGAGVPCYLQFQGACQLSHADRELDGHGPARHPQGYGAPLGKIKGFGKSPAELTLDEIKRSGGRFEFESGVVVEGRVRDTRREGNRNLVIALGLCTVKRGEEVLFRPEWGAFDMACGTAARSVFGGAADRGRYLAATGGYRQKPGRQKTNLTTSNRELVELYARVRKIRDAARRSGRQLTPADAAALSEIHGQLEASHPKDWLLRLELLELKGPWGAACRKRLGEIAAAAADKAEMIERGLALI